MSMKLKITKEENTRTFTAQVNKQKAYNMIFFMNKKSQCKKISKWPINVKRYLTSLIMYAM